MLRKVLVRALPALTLLAAIVVAAPAARATSITLANPSFEAPSLADKSTTVFPDTACPDCTSSTIWAGDPLGMNDWELSGNVGIWYPQVNPSGDDCTNTNYATQAFVSGIPDGKQVAYANGGSFTQTTAAHVTEGKAYVLKVAIGGRCLNYKAGYGVILGDGNPLISASGQNSVNTWFYQSVTYISPLGDPNAGETISVELQSGGIQVNFDNVTLDEVPAYFCNGFFTPFDQPIILKSNSGRAIPVKMVLKDVDGNDITDFDLSAPPVVQVKMTGPATTDSGYDGDLLPAGLADDGNAFHYDALAQQWILNLGTRPYTASGTYQVSVAAGDNSYAVASCTGTFERQ